MQCNAKIHHDHGKDHDDLVHSDMKKGHLAGDHDDHDDLVHAHMKKGHLAGLPRSPIVLTGRRCHRLHEWIHCNATHFRQCNAIHYDTMYYGAIYYDVIHCDAIHCETMQFNRIHLGFKASH